MMSSLKLLETRYPSASLETIDRFNTRVSQFPSHHLPVINELGIRYVAMREGEGLIGTGIFDTKIEMTSPPNPPDLVRKLRADAMLALNSALRPEEAPTAVWNAVQQGSNYSVCIYKVDRPTPLVTWVEETVGFKKGTPEYDWFLGEMIPYNETLASFSKVKKHQAWKVTLDPKEFILFPNYAGALRNDYSSETIPGERVIIPFSLKRAAIYWHTGKGGEKFGGYYDHPSQTILFKDPPSAIDRQTQCDTIDHETGHVIQHALQDQEAKARLKKAGHVACDKASKGQGLALLFHPSWIRYLIKSGGHEATPISYAYMRARGPGFYDAMYFADQEWAKAYEVIENFGKLKKG